MHLLVDFLTEETWDRFVGFVLFWFDLVWGFLPRETEHLCVPTRAPKAILAGAEDTLSRALRGTCLSAGELSMPLSGRAPSHRFPGETRTWALDPGSSHTEATLL